MPAGSGHIGASPSLSFGTSGFSIGGVGIGGGIDRFGMQFGSLSLGGGDEDDFDLGLVHCHFHFQGFISLSYYRLLSISCRVIIKLSRG